MNKEITVKNYFGKRKHCFHKYFSSKHLEICDIKKSFSINMYQMYIQYPIGQILTILVSCGTALVQLCTVTSYYLCI